MNRDCARHGETVRASQNSNSNSFFKTNRKLQFKVFLKLQDVFPTKNCCSMQNHIWYPNTYSVEKINLIFFLSFLKLFHFNHTHCCYRQLQYFRTRLLTCPAALSSSSSPGNSVGKVWVEMVLRRRNLEFLLRNPSQDLTWSISNFDATVFEQIIYFDFKNCIKSYSNY